MRLSGVAKQGHAVLYGKSQYVFESSGEFISEQILSNLRLKAVPIDSGSFFSALQQTEQAPQKGNGIVSQERAMRKVKPHNLASTSCLIPQAKQAVEIIRFVVNCGNFDNH